MTRPQLTFGLLVLAQAAHSVEEYVGRLWESFPPARYVTGLVAADREVGFLVINVALVLFGVWCFLLPVRRHWPAASAIMWGWALVEFLNGLGHPFWTLTQRGYTPGVATAPILFIISILLMRALLRTTPPVRTHSTRAA